MATKSTNAKRTRSRSRPQTQTPLDGALEVVKGAKESLVSAKDALVQQASRLDGKQWAAIAVGAGVLGGAALLAFQPRLVKRLLGGGLILSRMPFAPPLLVAAFVRAKDRFSQTVVPVLSKPAALLR